MSAATPARSRPGPAQVMRSNVVVLNRAPLLPQAEACPGCAMRSSGRFSPLGEQAYQRLHARVAQVQFEPGAVLFMSGERGTAVYTVRKGIVRFERVTERGDRRIVRLAGPGDLIGQESLLQRPYVDEAVACTAVEACRIPRAMVDELAAAEPEVTRELMQRWQRALDAAEDWVAELATGPGRRRMLRLLHRLGAYHDGEGGIWLPRRDEIGAMLDMTVETASRFVSQLRREGVLELRGPRGARVDAQALRRALEREDAD